MAHNSQLPCRFFYTRHFILKMVEAWTSEMLVTYYNTAWHHKPEDLDLKHHRHESLKIYNMVRGPFEKFVDSRYYSESELCGGAVTVSFSKYLPQKLHIMLHPLLKNMLQTVDHFKISSLRAPFSWLEKLRNCIGQDSDCMADILMGLN
jgi:hypothetical protein